MIVTLTPNPSLDRTLEVPDLRPGSVIRATDSRLDPGGKGVNISRALAANGHRTVAVMPCGGSEGEQLAELLASEGVEVVTVPIADSIRVNISVVEPDGTVTKLNAAGPRLSATEIDALAAATCAATAKGARWVALAGHLPPGAPVDLYAHLVSRLRGGGAPRIAVDSSGAPFAAALPAGPDLVKPNRGELAEAAGMAVTTLGEALTAANVLRERGARTVLASLGRDGALLVGDFAVLHGEQRVATPRSSVGAGDALLAGYLAAPTEGPAALAEALAWGSAAVSQPGSGMPGQWALDRSAVVVRHRIESDRPISERN
ncbi:1-phosphofructokinase family hexose kinase [Streptomyces coeruleorubidus]|uniref:1-phosphofructokinase family hexose kinase n=1 Tax=Streptomyces coeruleorubidus TaxID=116188 RepID=UPI00237F1739|nr:1-phosphofructokinase family hexose kinase [Streptomyces coeruleorubidus]WDV55571.1 1-phosphofructokinase family hexose kinase [Streptomyces coeruleorubidus]